MTEDWERKQELYREWEERLGKAVANRDPSQLLSAAERCSYSWRLAALGEWDQAENAAHAIDDDEDERGQALAVLSERLAVAGLAERAERVALSVTSDMTHFGAVHEKMCAFIECARAYCRNGRTQDAARVLESGFAIFPAFARQTDWEATDWLVDAAGVYASVGDHERALEILETAAEMVEAVSQDRAQIQAQIARTFASLSRLDRARAVAESITVPKIRERTLATLDSFHRDPAAGKP